MPLEFITALALNARLRGQSLTLAPSEVESLCGLLEDLITLKSKLARKGKGTGRKLQGDTPAIGTLRSRASRERQAAGLPRLRAKKKMGSK